MKPPADGAPPLTFRWPGKRRISFVLLGFIGLSLLAHVATFFLFQVVYPQRVTIPPTAPQVYVLSSSIPEHASLLRWIEAEDPALAAAPTRAEAPGLFEIAYKPSFASSRTPPRILPAEQETHPFPPAREPLVVIQSVTAQPNPAPPVRHPFAARLRFAGSLKDRELRQPASLPSGFSKALESATFLIGVTDRGATPFVFLQRSSGDDAADQAAAAYVTQLSFAPSDASVTWDFATIDWGDDSYSPEPSSQPAPPASQ